MVAERGLRIVYFGTPAFAVPSLVRLLDSNHRVVALVSQPDRPSGRGHRVQPTPTKTVALTRGLPVLQPERIKEAGFHQSLSALSPDLGVVAAYGRILPDALLALPRLGMINVHASILPAYRGAAPVHRAVMAGDTETGVTIMRVASELDAGATFAMRPRAIAPDETSTQVEHALAELGADLVVDVVDQIAAGSAVETPQDDSRATFAPKVTKAEGPVDWTLPAQVDSQPCARAAAVADGLDAARRHAAADSSHRLDGRKFRTFVVDSAGRFRRIGDCRRNRRPVRRRQSAPHSRRSTRGPARHVRTGFPRRSSRSTRCPLGKSMIGPARVAVYAVLRAVHGPNQDNLASALAEARTSLPNERDRALAGEIATGTLRWQGAFDHLIATFSNRPLARLDPEVVDILRMSMFQLLHLTRVPASAIVDDAVNLTKKEGKRSAAPLVNAILRRVSRERDRLPLPPRDAASREAALDYLSITLSHPRWLVGRWLERYGFEAAEAWCQFNNAPAALTVRANRLRTTAADLAAALREHGVATRPAQFAPDGLIVERGNPLLTPLAKSGDFVVQDQASQLVSLMTEVRPGEVVLDACASPAEKRRPWQVPWKTAGPSSPSMFDRGESGFSMTPSAGPERNVSR